MRSKTPEAAARGLRAADDRLGGRRGARGRGDQDRGRRRAGRAAPADARRRHRRRWSSSRRWAPPTPSARGPGAHRPPRRPSSCSTATCRWSPPRRSPRSPGPAGDRRGRATILTADLRRPDRLRTRRARRGRHGREGRRDQEAGGRHARGAARSRRSTPASTPSPARRCCRRSPRVGNDNAQGEYYLPDVLPLLRAPGPPRRRRSSSTTSTETLGVNDRVQLAEVRAIAQRRINEQLMRGGATIIDPDHTVIDVDVELAPDTLIEPGSALHGATQRGGGLGDRAAHHADRRHRRRRLEGHPQLRRRRRRSATASASARSPTCGRARSCARAPRPAPSSRSRTPRSARAPRCRT